MLEGGKLLPRAVSVEHINKQIAVIMEKSIGDQNRTIFSDGSSEKMANNFNVSFFWVETIL